MASDFTAHIIFCNDIMTLTVFLLPQNYDWPY